MVHGWHAHLLKAMGPKGTKLWLDVSCDWRKGPGSPGAQVFWDAERGFGQVWPRPSAEQVAAFYQLDSYYTHVAASAADLVPTSFLYKLLNRLAWSRDNGIIADAGWWGTVIGTRPLRILEIGCGDGRDLAFLESLGHDVTGVEPDPEARDNALARGLRVYDGHAENLPAAVYAEQYDVVLFLHVLEHCLDPERALANAHERIAPNGRLVVEVPNSECLGHVHFGPLWYFLDLPRHLNFFTERALKAQLQASGFLPERVDFAGYVRTFQPHWRRMQDQIAAAFGLSAPTAWHYWSYFARTAFAPPSQRYDSVRIVAMRADQPD